MHIVLFGGTTEGRKITEAIAEVNRERAAWTEHEDSSKFQHGEACAAGEDAAVCDASEPSGLPISAEVYVATAYGASLLSAGPGIRVHVGRLDAAEMTALFEKAQQTTSFASDERTEEPLDFRPEEISGKMGKAELPKSKGQCRRPETFGQAERCQQPGPVLVIDATHPYAAVVSENILAACAATGVRCIRVERESTGAEGKLTAPEGAGIHWVDSVEEAAAWLAREISDAKCMPGTSDMKTQVPGQGENGKERTLAARAAIGNAARQMPDRFSSEAAQRPNILITTGSKELAPYTRIPDFAARCYVRALPTVEALEKCQELGFRREHLILMQGPFSEEMNVAQLRYADAGYLVTKASGETGGFPEKCEAALALGVEVVCIGRPKEVSIPDAAWYDREKLDAVLRRIRETGTAGTCGSSATDSREDQAGADVRGMI